MTILKKLLLAFGGFLFLVLPVDLLSQEFGIMPIHANIHLIRNSSVGNILIGARAGRSEIVWGDCVYDTTYLDLFARELERQIDNYEFLKEAVALNADDVDELGDETLDLAFQNVMNNSLYFSILGNKERQERLSESIVIRPDLINPIADQLEREYLLYFSIFGVHWIKMKDDLSILELPPYIKGPLGMLCSVVDGTTGEIISQISPRKGELGWHFSAPKYLMYPEYAWLNNLRTNARERHIESMVRRMFNGLNRDLIRKGIIEGS